jgi:hypothetical protein
MNDTNNVTDSNTENLQNDTSVQDVSAQVEEDVVAAEPAPKGRLKEKKEKISSFKNYCTRPRELKRS